ncbi:MAG: hypothetical protein JWN14_895, partial [Chthonomonadales bacterium]|nr:hypothetical protein [Chthonomonadales bacterium]
MPRTTLNPALASLAALTLMALLTPSAHAQTFADTLVSSSGLGSNGLYNNPTATLG